jgi:uncharacterized protein (DUF1800 family)
MKIKCGLHIVVSLLLLDSASAERIWQGSIVESEKLNEESILLKIKDNKDNIISGTVCLESMCQKIEGTIFSKDRLQIGDKISAILKKNKDKSFHIKEIYEFGENSSLVGKIVSISTKKSKNKSIFLRAKIAEKLTNGKRFVNVIVCAKGCNKNGLENPEVVDSLKVGTEISAKGNRYSKSSFYPSSIKFLEVAVTPAPTIVPTSIPTAIPTVVSPPTAVPSIPSGQLFVASLKPQEGTVSTGSGFASFKLASDSKSGLLSVTYSGLSSGIVAAHVHGSDDSIVFDLDEGVEKSGSSFVWTFIQVGTYSPAKIIEELLDGKLYVNIHTSKFPKGEIKGNLRIQNVTATPVPTVGSSPIDKTDLDVARALQQTTFGATRSLIESVKNSGFSAYLEKELSKEPCTILDKVKKIHGNQKFTFYSVRGSIGRAWWSCVANGSDQLRQRVTFALSQIFVVSGISSGGLNMRLVPLSSYYDTLSAGAFGNFRQLLESITLHPAMGSYLNVMNNKKADPTKGTIPNENYAREVMQLFTIGLVALNQDGSFKLSNSGLPTSTYTQKDIEELAKVFTGWTIKGESLTKGDWKVPMIPVPANHSTESKMLLGGKCVLPANQTIEQDLKEALDCLFNHENVPPFISFRLIQNLVTSNPSPAYISRVAAKFINNGQGVRGDMKTVIKTILLDSEARTLKDAASSESYGRVEQPSMILSRIVRAFVPEKSRLFDHEYSARRLLFNILEQHVLYAPSVFNFFDPFHAQPGIIAQSGLVSPEFQTLDEGSLIRRINEIWRIIEDGKFVTTFEKEKIEEFPMDLSYEKTISSDTKKLITHLNILLSGGNVSEASQAVLESKIKDISDPEKKVKSAISGIVASSSFNINK